MPATHDTESKCEWCKQVFLGGKAWKSFCSRKCSDAKKYRDENPIKEKTCSECGGSFAGSRRIYCSRKCAYVARRRCIKKHCEENRYDLCQCGSRKLKKAARCKSCSLSFTTAAVRIADINVEGMVCVRCSTRRPLSEFDKQADQLFGVKPHCKACDRKSKRYRRMRMTDDDRRCERIKTAVWNAANKDRKRLTDLKITIRSWGGGYSKTELDAIAQKCLAQQECVICGSSRSDGRLHVDHDHATGRVRGVLCRGCNTSLGNVRESVDILRKMIDYLERPVP